MAEHKEARWVDVAIAQENIAWWNNLMQEHLSKGENIAARKCEEEIDLWKLELNL